MAGCCDYGNEPLYSRKYEEVSWLAEEQLLKKDCVLWSHWIMLNLRCC
jgi:hypothetical protein